LVLANSAGTARRCEERGACHTRVVHLGTDLPAATAGAPGVAGSSEPPTLVTVGNLIARKRHADVIEAMALLHDRWPQLRYVVVGDGPERAALQALATTGGVADRVQWRGRLDHATAVSVARSGSLFVLPSVAEAFGVAYVEAAAAARTGPRRSRARAAASSSSPLATRMGWRTRSTGSCPRPNAWRRWARPHVRRSRHNSPGSGVGARPWRRTRRC